MVLKTTILRISVISICISSIWFSVLRFNADMDMKTARRWFATRNISKALEYTKKAIAKNPTEIRYKINLYDLENIYFSLLQANAKKVVIRRPKNVQ